MIRVLVVAPGMALRIGLRALLQGIPEIEVCGEGASLSDVIPETQQVGLFGLADVLLVAGDPVSSTFDFHQPAGLEGLRGLVVLTDQVERAAALVNVWEGAAWGVLGSEATVEELAAAIHAVYEGLVAGAPEILAKVLTLPESGRDASRDGLIELTHREREVLQYLAQGLANKQIGHALGISEHTIKFHVSGIYTKLGVTNRTEAVRVGLQHGLISL